MLNEEEEKAIENLKDFKSISILYGNTFTMFLEQLKKYQEATDTVLNLTTKLQKENKELKTTINKQSLDISNNLLELQQKDKQIDLMAYTLQDNLYLTPLDGLNKEELKQYFETKAKKGE